MLQKNSEQKILSISIFSCFLMNCNMLGATRFNFPLQLNHVYKIYPRKKFPVNILVNIQQEPFCKRTPNGVYMYLSNK